MSVILLEKKRNKIITTTPVNTVPNKLRVYIATRNVGIAAIR